VAPALDLPSRLDTSEIWDFIGAHGNGSSRRRLLACSRFFPGAVPYLGLSLMRFSQPSYSPGPTTPPLAFSAQHHRRPLANCAFEGQADDVSRLPSLLRENSGVGGPLSLGSSARDRCRSARFSVCVILDAFSLCDLTLGLKA